MFKFPHENHPIWILIRQLTLVVYVYILLCNNYNSWDNWLDPRMMVLYVLGGTSFDLLKKGLATGTVGSLLVSVLKHLAPPPAEPPPPTPPPTPPGT
jgi:hypothetical protein